MSNRPFVLPATIVVALAAAGCGGGAEPAPPTPAVTNEWRFSVDEHIALWYHGLALADPAASGTAPVPLYRDGYAADVADARRRIDGSTRLESTLGARLEASGAIDGLQFLPLYFDSWQQLVQAIDVWTRAEGDPRRAADQQTAAIIAFLSQRFPNATQRAAVHDFATALEHERQFFGAWWSQSQPARLAEQTQALWRSLQPRMTAFLRYTDAGGGVATLVPALRGEGRSESGRGVAVAAVGGMTGEDARVIAGRVIHELAYPIAAEATRDAVAPARIREIGESELVARAAVRAGAMVIERVAPELLDAYRDDYIRAARADPASTSLEAQFPLPDELADALESSVRLATAGI